MDENQQRAPKEDEGNATSPRQSPARGWIVAIVFFVGVVLHNVVSVPLGPARRTITLVLAVSMLLALVTWHNLSTRPRPD
jgi:hypothetical protein